MPFNRGIIGKYANTSSRTGLVTAKEQFILAAGGFYPRFVPSDVTATISRLLSLLVKTDGSNGGDNTSIVDSSTNAYSITVNGNSQTASISPHDPEGYSYYFDGSGDYIAMPSNSTDVQLGSGDFTVEAWVYPTSSSAINEIINKWQGNSTQSSWRFFIDTNNALQFSYRDSNGTTYVNVLSAANNSIRLNEWQHVAVTRNGSTWRLFSNGIKIAEATNSGTINNGSYPVWIGRLTDAFSADNSYTGYISDARIIKGTALYTTEFTPPTERLTAVENTSLLTCHLSYLADGSSTGHTLTANGNVIIDPISPYRGIPFDADLHGGSVYFDGSGDYLSIADAAPLDLGNGSTDFTIEFWALADSAYNTSTSDYVFYSKYQNPGNGIIIRVWDGELVVNLSGDAFDIETGFYPQPGIWHHYALVCNSGTVTMYADGVSRGTYSSAIVGDSGTSTTIGCLYYSGVINPFKGYISDFRIVKGTAIYTAAFTPPTEPLTAVANTSLFIKGNESAIYDATGFNTVFLAGNATTSTTQTKYATSSIKLDGTGNYLYFKEDNFALGTNDFTIELWAYIESFTGPSSSSPIIIDFRTASTAHPLLYIPVGTSNLVWYYNNGARITGTSCLTLNTWHHIAVSRISGLTKLFVDGTQVGSSYADTNNYGVGTNRPYVGKNGANVNGELQGYIEDLRITQGLGRYPWIPEKETLTTDSNTYFLTGHASSITDGSGNSSISASGNAAVTNYAPKSGMYSIDFDGTDDKLTVTNPYTIFGDLSGDYTIECWVNMDAVPADDGNGHENQIIGQHSWPESSPYNGFWALFAVASGIYYYTSTGSNYTLHQATSMSWTVGKWTHVAVVKSSGTVYIYIDGGLQTSGANSDTIFANDNRALTIGSDIGNTTDFNGQISNLRVSNIARYTSDFTPPTAALT